MKNERRKGIKQKALKSNNKNIKKRTDAKISKRKKSIRKTKKKTAVRNFCIAAGILMILAFVVFLAIYMKNFNADKNNAVSDDVKKISSESSDASAEKSTNNKEQEKIDEILNNMTLDEKINQMFFITPESLTGIGCAISAGEKTKNALAKHPVGGIIYFSQNFTDEKQTKEMLSNIKAYGEEVCKVPLFIGIDEEGGTVARLGNSENINVEKVDNMSQIGKTGDLSKANEAGITIGEYLAEYGFNIDFAPVADVITNPYNTVVKDRSFGSDPKLVSEMAQEVSNGLNEKGVYSCFKHFPGHGATKDDTHEGFAYTDKSYDELMESELVPFIDAIKNDADFIMVGHISLPTIIGDNTPASISDVMITDILKQKLGFKGIVITDSLAMGALTNIYQSDEIAVRTIKAGADMLLMPQDFELAYNGVVNAVKSGEISEERINTSVRKIIEKKMNFNNK